MSFSDEPSTVSFGGYSQRNPAMDQQMREAIQVSISSTIYAQLIHAQIPKAKKKTVKSSIFFVHLGSAPIKAALKMLVKSFPGWGERHGR